MEEVTTVTPRRTRNRAQTCQNILDAFGKVMIEEGLDGVGVNRIAELAGVSKVLIYRYFGGLEGLAEQYVHQSRLFPRALTATEISRNADNSQAKLSCWHLLSTFHLIRQQPKAQELMKSLVREDDELSRVISRTLEEEMTHFGERFHLQSPVDSQAVAAVLMSAMTYLTLLSKSDRKMVGIDLGDDRGWHRIENAIAAIFEGLYCLTASDLHRHNEEKATIEAFR